MEERKELLMESIAKLLSLRVPEEEIILNLKDVGLSGQEAKELLEETKGKKPSLHMTAGVAGERDFSKKDSFPLPLRQAQEDLEKSDEPSPPSTKKKVPAPPEKEHETKRDEGVLVLWEKGVMATINSKLSEMEKLKSDIESVIDKKIEKGLKKEVKKIETIFEGQRKLGAQSIREALESKSKAVEEMLDAKIEELKKMNEMNQDYMDKLEAQKKANEEALQEMNSKLEELEELKSSLIADMNSDLIKSKSKVEKFLEEADEKRKETVERINRSLELETKIVEGLMNDAKQKIDSLALEKSAKFENDLKARFEKQKNALSEKIRELEGIEQRIDLDSIKKSMEGLALEKSTKFENDLKKRFENQKKILDEKIKKLEEAEQRIDIEAIKNTMEELDVFRQQFARQIKKNVASFNLAKKELTDLIRQREQLIDKQLEIMQLKIEEFEAFKKQFAQELGVQIDELVEKKKQAKQENKKDLGNIIKKKT